MEMNGENANDFTVYIYVIKCMYLSVHSLKIHKGSVHAEKDSSLPLYRYGSSCANGQGCKSTAIELDSVSVSGPVSTQKYVYFAFLQVYEAGTTQ